MATPVEQIKDRLSIVDVVGGYVTLAKAGKHFKGKSPFTNEKTPSFFVSPERNMYYCFSSGKGGDVFTFIEEMEGVDFKGALKLLAERAGVELRPEDPKTRSEREALYALLEDATQFFVNNLKKDTSAVHYIEKRGVTKETAEKWRIGFVPDEWRTLKEYLLEKGYTEALIKRAGLIKDADGAKSAYDVFRNRIMFPITDASGRVVAFSGRTLSTDPASPKYVNSPETELFQKSHILFGYAQSKQGIRSYDFTLIVEGQFDLVLAHQVGYTNTVAISGTALSVEHIKLLERLSNRVVLALDSDTAGIESVKRAASLMLARGIDVKVARIEGGKDPADLAKEDPALLKKAIGSATHVIEFLIKVLKAEAKDERTFSLRVRDEVIPFVVTIPSTIDRGHFEKIIAESIQSTVDAVHHDVVRTEAEMSKESVKESAREERTTVGAPAVKKPRREEDLIAHLFGILLWQSAEQEPSIDAKMLEGHMKTVLGDEGMTLLTDWPDDVKNTAIFKAERSYTDQNITDDDQNGVVMLEKSIAELLRELHLMRLRAKLAHAQGTLREIEKAGDTKEIETMLQQCEDIRKELSDLDTKNPFILELESNNT